METKKDSTTEEKILNSAEELFLEKGFALTSTTEIAKAAGCNHALVHYYFRTKEKLFQKIFENKLALLFNAFFAANDPHDSFEQKICKKVSAHFDILVANPKLPALILSDMVGHKERMRLAIDAMGSQPRRLLKQLEEELEAEIQQGKIRPIKAYDFLLNILSLNVFFFLSMPLFLHVMDINEEMKRNLLEHRKQEIVETLLRSLRPE